MGVEISSNPYLDVSLFTERDLEPIGEHSGVFNLKPYDLHSRVMKSALMGLSSMDGAYAIDASAFLDMETLANTCVLIDRLVAFAKADRYKTLTDGVLWIRNDCYLIHTGASDPMITLPTELILRFIYGYWQAYDTVGILDLRRNKCYSIPSSYITDNICDRVMKELVLA